MRWVDWQLTGGKMAKKGNIHFLYFASIVFLPRWISILFTESVQSWLVNFRHPFDSSKWGRICRFLISEGFLDKKHIVEPLEATKDDLRVVFILCWDSWLACFWPVSHVQMDAAAFAVSFSGVLKSVACIYQSMRHLLSISLASLLHYFCKLGL